MKLYKTVNQLFQIYLAPMDGYTDTAYRQIVRKINPHVILLSEFTSIMGMRYNDQIQARLNFQPEEKPYLVQLFGNDPQLFPETIKKIEQLGVDGINLNMGCPSKRIVRSFNGAALMKDPTTACRIIEACKKATQLPISVKTRLGWSNTNDFFSFNESLINAGADSLIIHARTAKQGYQGHADWGIIYQFKKYLCDHQSQNHGIIGNGDIQNYEDGLNKTLNLNGFMIGRAAIGNPWIFLPKEKRLKVTWSERLDIIQEHYHLLRKYKSEKQALIEFRKHITGYISEFENARSYRQLLMQATTDQGLLSQLMHISKNSTAPLSKL